MNIIKVIKIEPCKKCGEIPKVKENVFQYSETKGIRYYSCWCTKCQLCEAANTREEVVEGWNKKYGQQL